MLPAILLRKALVQPGTAAASTYKKSSQTYIHDGSRDEIKLRRKGKCSTCSESMYLYRRFKSGKLNNQPFKQCKVCYITPHRRVNSGRNADTSSLSSFIGTLYTGNRATTTPKTYQPQSQRRANPEPVPTLSTSQNKANPEPEPYPSANPEPQPIQSLSQHHNPDQETIAAKLNMKGTCEKCNANMRLYTSFPGGRTNRRPFDQCRSSTFNVT